MGSTDSRFCEGQRLSDDPCLSTDRQGEPQREESALGLLLFWAGPGSVRPRLVARGIGLLRRIRRRVRPSSRLIVGDGEDAERCF